MTEQVVRAPQPVRQRGEHFQCDARIALEEREKILARQLRETRVFDDRGVGRAPPPVEHRHFAEEIARPELGQRHRMTVGVGNADAHFAAVDQIH